MSAADRKTDRNLVVCSTALLAALGLAAAPAIAQDGGGSVGGSGDNAMQQQMDAMRKELERVQQANNAMRGEIDQLRAENDGEWMTEQRSNEIKGLVQDVLADADTRASLLDTGMTAGWNDHFFLASTDGRFLLQFEGLQQTRFYWNHHDEPDYYRYGFENANTELTFRGHVFSENIEYMIRGNFARSGGNFVLEDAWTRYRFDDKWAVRVGQFKLPFSREYLIYNGEQQLVERSLVNLFFTPKYGQGVELEYGDSQNRFSASFQDNNGVGFNQDAGANTSWSAQDTEWAATARYERLVAGTWEQFSGFTSKPGDEFGLLIGLGFAGEQGEATGAPTANRDENRLLEFTGDVSADWGGANVFGSFYYAYWDSPNAIVDFFGFTIQAGIYVAPKWELFARGEYLFLDTNVENSIGDLIIATVGVNYYIDGQDLKWTTDFGYGFQEVNAFYANDAAGWRGDSEGANPQMVFRTQFQLMF